MLNLHHLELFYYVAKHQGIVEACRHIPYGVQQPAVSAQIIRLEEEIGTSLFRRRPFQLSATGRELFDYLSPFFGNLPQIEARLRGESVRTLRLAGLSEVMRDHAPELLARLKKKNPRLQLTVQEADQRNAEQMILHGEADLAVTVLDKTPPAGLHCQRLLKLPVVLWVHEASSWQTASEAIKAGAAGKLDLISLPAHELLPRLFARGMKKLKREWSITIEVNSAELIGPYVSNGLGAGLTVSSPHLPRPSGIRELPLKGFPQLSVGAFWAGRLSPIAQEFVDHLTTIARGSS
ncbi:MAG TPA: LysR family transcriptional regulator [Chthoniobacterales bacterium]|nr:LysR family transcriptional regulator [Chthoniobacterales bacterium]